jgi:pimeloyl-ACP methyl ester carboxylesterase
MGTLAPAAPGHATDISPTPAWGACPPPSPGTQRDARQQCATLSVPLDYRNQRGRAIDIAISRIPTAKPGLRRGILLSNPGGPGGQGLDLPSTLAVIFPAEVLDRFDLIGFDPRGVGHSTPVTCGLPPATLVGLERYPAPDGSITDNVEYARSTAEGCATHSGDLLPYITTANTARDMDRIRAALGERTLSYYGTSYGTYLGAVYTSLFPGRSDRIVLDSAVDPRRVWYEQFRTIGLGYELRFPDFTAWAAARDDTYHLGTTSAQVRQAYFRLGAELDRDPLTTPFGFVITGNLFRLLTHGALNLDAHIPVLAAFWQHVATRGATPLPPLPPLGYPTPPNVPADNFVAAELAVVCDDAPWPRHTLIYALNVTIDRQLFPMTNGVPSNIWACAFWPNEPVEPPVAVNGRGPRNVLILQNRRDPATPWITGVGLRHALAPRAVMISVDAGGHGVYPYQPGSCAYNFTNAFLARGELPARDTSCPGPSPGTQTPSAAATLTPFAPPGFAVRPGFGQ